MKVALLVLLTALVLGGLVGVLMARDPGYVMVAYDQMALETSLWFALLVLVLAYVLIRAATLLTVRLVRGGGSLKDWHQRRRTRTAREQTVKGLLLMAEARWAEARKLLESSADNAPSPLINYLNAARAAHEMGDTRGRNALLRAAHESHESTPGARFAVGLTQAELQCAEGRWEQCLATVLELRRQSPRHPQVLRMLVLCYQRLEDWQAILELVPDLKKQHVMPEPELRALQVTAWRGRLGHAGDDLPELWKSVPKELRRDAELVAVFVGTLLAAGRAGEAELRVREALEQSWNGELVHLYGTFSADDPNRQLVAAEGWLKERPNDPTLLLTLGRISLMNHLWAKAREYFEASLRLHRTTEVQGELGRLCVALGESQQGAELLVQALDTLPPLPMPERSEAPQALHQGRGA